MAISVTAQRPVPISFKLAPSKYTLSSMMRKRSWLRWERCFYLVLLDIENALDYLRVVIDELWNHGKGAHNADVDFHSCVRP